MKELYIKLYSLQPSSDNIMLLFGNYGFQALFFPISSKRPFKTKNLKLIETAVYLIKKKLIKFICIKAKAPLVEIVSNKCVKQFYHGKSFKNQDLPIWHN